MNNFHMFSFKSLLYGAFIIGIIVFALTCVTDVINKLFITYFLMRIILKFKDTNRI